MRFTVASMGWSRYMKDAAAKRDAIEDMANSEIDVSEIEILLDENPDALFSLTTDEINALLDSDPAYMEWSESTEPTQAEMDAYADAMDMQGLTESIPFHYDELMDDGEFRIVRESENKRISIQIPPKTLEMVKEYLDGSKILHNRNEAIDYLLLKGLVLTAKEAETEKPLAVLTIYKPPITETDFFSEKIPTDNPLKPTEIAKVETPQIAKLLFGMPIGKAYLKPFCSMIPAEIMRKLDTDAETANRIALTIEYAKRVACSHADRKTVGSPSDVADYLMPLMRHLNKEIVLVLAIDTKGGIHETMQIAESDAELVYKDADIINTGRIFEGTLNASVFHPREILKFAIDANANSIVLAHNHPSGDPQPSQEDIRATKQLMEAANYVGIKVLDHVVIGDGIFYSMKEEGAI